MTALWCRILRVRLQSAVSSKVHGGAGTFTINLPFDATTLLTGIGIEDRSGGGSYQIVATFSGPVTVGSVSVTSGTGAATFGTAGATCTINLTGVTNVQRLGVTLTNVTVGARNGDITIPMGVLIGDTSANGSVNAGDVSQTKAQSGAPVGAGNFREDVTVNGSYQRIGCERGENELGHRTSSVIGAEQS